MRTFNQVAPGMIASMKRFAGADFARGNLTTDQITQISQHLNAILEVSGAPSVDEMIQQRLQAHHEQQHSLHTHQPVSSVMVHADHETATAGAIDRHRKGQRRVSASFQPTAFQKRQAAATVV